MTVTPLASSVKNSASVVYWQCSKPVIQRPCNVVHCCDFFFFLSLFFTYFSPTITDFQLCKHTSVLVLVIWEHIVDIYSRPHTKNARHFLLLLEALSYQRTFSYRFVFVILLLLIDKLVVIMTLLHLLFFSACFCAFFFSKLDQISMSVN